MTKLFWKLGIIVKAYFGIAWDIIWRHSRHSLAYDCNFVVNFSWLQNEFKVAQSSFQQLDFDKLLLPLTTKNCPVVGEHVVIIFVTQKIIIVIVWPAKKPLITTLEAYDSKTARWNFFYFFLINEHDKTQLLAKFQKICT